VRYRVMKALPIVACALASWSVQAVEMVHQDMAAVGGAPAATLKDTRALIKLKPETIGLLRADMRGMLSAFGNVLALLGDGKKKEAAAVLETELGMSAMKSHPGMMKANRELPEDVRRLGMTMHKGASTLARNIDSLPPAGIFLGMSEISSGCVSCHMAYRVR
jgi:hypothetical protein